MKKGKTLSFILASVISLSQIVPGLYFSQKAYASTNEIEKEITNESEFDLEGTKHDLDNPSLEKLDSKDNTHLVDKENQEPAKVDENENDKKSSNLASPKQAKLRSLDDKTDDKIDIKSSLVLTSSRDHEYPKDYYKNMNWKFTIKNDSDKTIYLKELVSSGIEGESSNTNSKNLFISGIEFNTENLNLPNELKDLSYIYIHTENFQVMK